MSDDVPSPAGKRRPAAPSHNGLVAMPWETALYDAVRALERRTAEAEAETQRLIGENHLMRKKLRESKQRLENWELRRQAWKLERDELLRRLG